MTAIPSSAAPRSSRPRAISASIRLCLTRRRCRSRRRGQRARHAVAYATFPTRQSGRATPRSKCAPAPAIWCGASIATASARTGDLAESGARQSADELRRANGTGRRAQLDGIQVAGKTGTTNGYRDAWFVGYTGTPAARSGWATTIINRPAHDRRHHPALIGTTSWPTRIRASNCGLAGPAAAQHAPTVANAGAQGVRAATDYSHARHRSIGARRGCDGQPAPAAARRAAWTAWRARRRHPDGGERAVTSTDQSN